MFETVELVINPVEWILAAAVLLLGLAVRDLQRRVPKSAAGAKIERVNLHPPSTSAERSAMSSTPSAKQRLATRLAIHIEKGELAYARWLIDRATLDDCTTGTPPPGVLSEPVGILPIGKRTLNLLESHEIYTVGELLGRRPDELTGLDGLGDHALQEIYSGLEAIGLRRG